MDDPPATPVDDDAVDVAVTATTYAENAPDLVEKYLDFSLFERHGDAFRDALPTPRDRPPRVLDVGCGPGADTAPMADAGLDVVGLDLTPQFLHEAREQAPDARLLRGDMRALPVATATFEGLWSSAAFLHLPRSEATPTLDGFHRVLAPRGALLLSVMASETRDADAVELPDGRRFTFWQEESIRDRLREAGFAEVRALGGEENWHALLAVRD
ncbi:class I SAM-dependent methyltransferase [Halolamina sp. CBA1230]|uniref:class I SAM-dependent methyltransferase n=1 Tax=Halolamina sp. CBA1230 TaxID=1853690 RepID=UPI0009A1C6B6|nr:class I SAM-dependent methyltransferase [Halolamina sp. CBA1230]QKY21378.1 class I SAM-dependent methyltransferase [Halolamina sp. CBA1230]